MKTINCLCILFLLLSSCSKNNSKEPDKPDLPKSVVGYWVGKYGNGDDAPNSPYMFLLKNDGTMRAYDNPDTTLQNKTDGVYTFESNKLTCSYKFNESFDLSATATLSADGKTLTGTFGSRPNTTGRGNFKMTRQ